MLIRYDELKNEIDEWRMKKMLPIKKIRIGVIGNPDMLESYGRNNASSLVPRGN